MFLLSVVVSFFVVLTAATNVSQCPGKSYDGLKENVQLMPCKKLPCRLKKGTSPNITIHFIPVYNWCEVKAKMWILNLGKPVNIPVLSQEMAIELGANLLGETVIFVIGAGLLVIEYNRQSKKEAAKEAKREEEMKHITTTITDLYFTVQQQQTQLREMERMIYSLDGKKPKTPLPNGPTPPASPTTPPVPPKPQNINYNAEYEVHASPTPYPGQGVILQSLNYIQMDVFSSFFSHSQERETNQRVDKPQPQFKRDPALLSEALQNIENNFRSLF